MFLESLGIRKGKSKCVLEIVRFEKMDSITVYLRGLEVLYIHENRR